MNELTSEQQVAMDGMKAFGRTWEIATLEGVAGSGKTYTVGAFLDTLFGSVMAPHVAVACPTWKALSVVQVPQGVDTMTVHSLLGLRLVQLPGGETKCVPEGECKLHKYDLVIVDEASMIGADLFGMLLDPGRRQNCCVLFVGDPMQLAPVGGDTLSPAFTEVNTRWRLNTVVRQAQDNPIIQASVVVRQYIESGERIPLGVLGEALESNGGKEKKMAGIVNGSGYNVVALALDRIQAGDDARVLCYTNEAVKLTNSAIHMRIYGRDSAETAGFEPGEKIIMQDEYKVAKGESLKNSEECEVIAVEPCDELLDCPSAILHLKRGDYEVSVPVPIDRLKLDRYIKQLFNSFRNTKSSSNRSEQDKGEACNNHAWQLINTFANVRHAYASTVHKAQGSTYDTVIIDWADCSRIRVDHEFNRAIYVGMTRPREKMAIVGKVY